MNPTDRWPGRASRWFPQALIAHIVASSSDRFARCNTSILQLQQKHFSTLRRTLMRKLHRKLRAGFAVSKSWWIYSWSPRRSLCPEVHPAKSARLERPGNKNVNCNTSALESTITQEPDFKDPSYYQPNVVSLCATDFGTAGRVARNQAALSSICELWQVRDHAVAAFQKRFIRGRAIFIPKVILTNDNDEQMSFHLYNWYPRQFSFIRLSVFLSMPFASVVIWRVSQ